MSNAIASRSVRNAREQRLIICGPPDQRARIVDALKGRATIRSSDTLGDLEAFLTTTVIEWDSVLIVVEPSQTAAAANVIRSIARTRPDVALIACCRAGAQYSTDIRSLAMAGVHQFVFAGIDDSGIALRAVVQNARRNCAAESVLRELMSVVPRELLPMIETILARPAEILSVSDLAGAMRVHRRTLFNKCERAQFLGPAEVITWTRLALVSQLLASTGVTVEALALDLCFASDTALRNLMKRYTGLRAGQIRELGGVNAVVEGLKARISNGRLKMHLV